MDINLWARGGRIVREAVTDMLTSLRFYGYAVGVIVVMWTSFNIYLVFQSPGNIFYPSLNPKAVYAQDSNIFLYIYTLASNNTNYG